MIFCNLSVKVPRVRTDQVSKIHALRVGDSSQARCPICMTAKLTHTFRCKFLLPPASVAPMIFTNKIWSLAK
jgi:hypothetical protein